MTWIPRRRFFAPIIAVAAASVCVARAGAAGDPAPVLVGIGSHVSYQSPEHRDAGAPDRDMMAEQAPAAAGGRSGALVITPSFDVSITSDPNSSAIKAVVNDAIAATESLFDDPIGISILFRYATTEPNGSPMPGGALAISNFVIYSVAWTTYLDDLQADARSANDTTANASLPPFPLSAHVIPSSAGGRALGANTPPAMFANGSVGLGGPFDGIVTLNANQDFAFTRPPSTGFFDAQRATEHEIDEVMGLGSAIGFSQDLRPQDLFSWSAPGVRNLSTNGSRYFSIDGGSTDIVGFNQTFGGDFGDWLSGSCPQPHPFVQNAFSCPGQVSDIGQTSPEGINLDVIGYDLLPPSAPTPKSTATPKPNATPLPELRNIAIVDLKAPKRVKLKATAPVANKKITVQLQNRGSNIEVVPSFSALAALVGVQVVSLGATCAAPPAALIADNSNKVPRSIKPRGKLKLVFMATFACANDPKASTRKDPGHDDFKYLATLNPGALGAAADVNPVDDLCPRPATGLDASTDPTHPIIDKGCGGKFLDRTLGADVTTDVAYPAAGL